MMLPLPWATASAPLSPCPLVHSPCFALADTPLVLRVLVVQLVVAGVSAPGGGRDHRSGLGVGEARRRVVPRACRDKKTQREMLGRSEEDRKCNVREHSSSDITNFRRSRPSFEMSVNFRSLGFWNEDGGGGGELCLMLTQVKRRLSS